MAMIEAEGSGVIVALARRRAGIAVAVGQPSLRQAGRRPARRCRSYGIGAQILAALGIHDMILLSNTRHSPVGLSAYGLAIVEERCIQAAEK